MTHRTIGCMLLLIVFTSMVTSSRADETNAPAVGVRTNESGKLTITTTKGITFENCKLTRAEPDGLTLLHSKGIAKLPFSELPPEFAKRYGYDPQKAYQYARDAAEKRAEFASEQQRASQRRTDNSSYNAPSSGSGQWEACIMGGRIVVGTASSYEGANQILHEKGLVDQGIIRRKR